MSRFAHALDAVLDHLTVAQRAGRRLHAGLDSLRALCVAERDSIIVLETPAETRTPFREVATAALASVPLPLRLTDASLSKTERLAQLAAITAGCVKCPHLAASRRNVVFGVGNPEAELMFVGEAPGVDEDAQAEPFVGRAGQLLTKIVQTMGYAREDVFIANILKCRPDTPDQPSGNRPPTVGEMQTCLPYLEEQVEIVGPRVLVALGNTAARGLLAVDRPMRELRGRWHEYRGTPVMVTYHPSYLLRNQALGEKRKTWEDMLLVKERLGHEIAERARSYFLPKSGATAE